MRVGVDQGFDRGAAAWALDVPGCAATARSKDDVLRKLEGVAASFVAWIGEEAGERPEGAEGPVDVVEHVDSYLLDDGYEVNATFDDDRRPVTRVEAEGALRWLQLAHTRFRNAIDRSGGVSLSEDGRARDELINHVIRAERWLATRTEPDQAAITFPPEDPPVERQLADNRTFVRRHVLRGAEGDGINARVDSKGESWTARKVIRRLIYHVLDHAAELERRSRQEARGA